MPLEAPVMTMTCLLMILFLWLEWVGGSVGR